MKIKNFALFPMVITTIFINAMEQKIAPSAPEETDLPPAYTMAITMPQGPSSSTINTTDREYEKLLAKTAELEEKHPGSPIRHLISCAYTCNDKDIVLGFINEVRCDIGNLPMQAAILSGRIDTIKALFPYQTDTDITEAAEYALNHGPAESLAVFLNHPLFKKDIKFKTFYLNTAIEHNDIEKVKAILTHKGNFKPDIWHVERAAMLEQDNADIINLLIQHGAPVNPPLQHSKHWHYEFEAVNAVANPLYIAVKKNKPKTVQSLLNGNANPLCCCAPEESTEKCYVKRFTNAEDYRYQKQVDLLKEAQSPSIKKALLEAIEKEKNKNSCTIQ